MGKFIFTQTEIPGVVVIEPQVFGDDRGYFMETYQKDQFAEAGIDKEFVQDNQSRSTRGVLRGLHFQKNHTQGKLVRVTKGEVYDVAVDCRPHSATFGKYQLDLVLRNNITTPEHPLGVYHPHAKLHHIKKENIGLIEVMGLAVLPSRLKQELFDLADVLVAHLPTAEYPEALQKHAAWAEEILAKHPELNADNVHLILQDEVGHVFAQVLADAGVYKLDEAGRAGFVRFLESVK